MGGSLGSEPQRAQVSEPVRNLQERTAIPASERINVIDVEAHERGVTP
jgi:hypothetical protein